MVNTLKTFNELLLFVASRTSSLSQSPMRAQITDFTVASETEFKAEYSDDSDITMSQNLFGALAVLSKMTTFEGTVDAVKQMETEFRVLPASYLSAFIVSQVHDTSMQCSFLKHSSSTRIYTMEIRLRMLRTAATSRTGSAVP